MTLQMNPLSPATLASLQVLAQELRGIAEANWQGYAAWTISETGILHGDRVRHIGEQAERLAVFPGQQIVAGDALALHPDRHLATAAMSEINSAWSGIGSWQA